MTRLRLKPLFPIPLLIVALAGVEVRGQLPHAESSSAHGTKQTVRVVGVHDGDTITVLTEGKEQIKVRLDAIDAPELGQPFGQSSKKALSDLVFGKDVVVVSKKKDRYGRTIGHVIADDQDANLHMLEKGMAWHYREYSKNARLQQAEDSARSAKKGLWTDANPVPPWEWRKEHRKGK